ncbi:hypothetical protein ETU08_10905 [Apibacter muscae]|uniref:Uncharacterized protein n=1 Tax=Apibacter muscae TaxID=2509004 RepID=A0A563D941_9FLAO|nr:hypothetical protein [Apibacter muscae]TWP26637.1 hypothetical protein ETU09_08725 [Apibacter muscae]TWP28211.1 hypothetical protein ETU08_10905 [Apibacter muscae]
MKRIIKKSPIFLIFCLLIIILFPLKINAEYSPEKQMNEGSKHSILFPKVSNAKVIHEIIEIDVVPYFNDPKDYFVNYNITYHIESDHEQILPLIFIASNFKNSPINILINGKEVNTNSILDNQNLIFSIFPYIKSDGNENVCIIDTKNNVNLFNIKELVYFNSLLKKGKNEIHLNYKGNLESNNYGFLKNYNLDYYLFPYKFWNSFGPIFVKLNTPPNYKIKQSSIGNPSQKLSKNLYFWRLNKINKKEFKISLSPKISTLSYFLLLLKPVGITLTFGLLISLIHIYFIKKFRKKDNHSINYYLILGNIINPPLFYLTYCLSFKLIEWSLGSIALKNYEYIISPILYLPLIYVLYDYTMWFLDISLKNNTSLKNT